MQEGRPSEEGAVAADSSLLLQALDENLRACVLLHLTPCDLVQVSKTCRMLATDAQRNVVWATLFLRRFGCDFWGEHITSPHPYHEVPKRPPNKWDRLLPSTVFETFLQESCLETTPEEAEATHDTYESEARRELLNFVQQYENQSQREGGWKAAYHMMHKMVKTWWIQADVGFLVAGHTSFARLSTIMDVIKEAIIKDEFQEGQRKPKHPISPLDCVDLMSPGGACRVIRTPLERAKSWQRQSCHANFCVVRKPRRWWAQKGKYMFKGLRLDKADWGIRMHLIFVLDCERMHEPDYQETAFRELHGLLGEGKGQFEEGIFVILYLVNVSKDYDAENILKRLKIPLLVEPEHWCPYYAGPVVFVVTCLSMPPTESTTIAQRKQGTSKDGKDATDETKIVLDGESKERILKAFLWLLHQPSSRPHWNTPSTEQTYVCALTDQRSEQERGN